MRGIDPAATKGRERGASPLPANVEMKASPGIEHAWRLQTRGNHSWPSEFIPRKSTFTGFDGLPVPRSFAGRITVPKDAHTVLAFFDERLQRGFASDQLASGGFAACFSIRRPVGNGWGLCPQTPEVFQAWPRRSMRDWKRPAAEMAAGLLRHRRALGSGIPRGVAPQQCSAPFPRMTSTVANL